MYKAIGESVLVKLIQKENKTASGIILVQADKPTEKGVIVSVGNKANEELKEGQTVHFKRFVGVDVGEFRVLNDFDVLLVEQ